MPRRSVALLVTVTATLVAGAALAAPLDITLTFGSLPSAQGFTYTPSGAHTGVPEANIFSVSSNTLHQNSMGQSNGVSGGSIFYVRLNGITTTESKQIRVRARCLQAEGSANATLGQGGFCFGFATGSVQYDFGLTPTRIFVLQPSGTVVLAGTYDNTQYHDYVYDWTPPSTSRLYRDGVLITTITGGFSVATNRIFLGDGTGGANAQGDVTAFRFIQDMATPAVASSWGRVKSVYR